MVSGVLFPILLYFNSLSKRNLGNERTDHEGRPLTSLAIHVQGPVRALRTGDYDGRGGGIKEKIKYRCIIEVEYLIVVCIVKLSPWICIMKTLRNPRNQEETAVFISDRESEL